MASKRGLYKKATVEGSNAIQIEKRWHFWHLSLFVFGAVANDFRFTREFSALSVLPLARLHPALGLIFFCFFCLLAAFAPWRIHIVACSPPGLFVFLLDCPSPELWLFCLFAGFPLALLPPGFFAPWLIRLLALSPPGLFAPCAWLIRPLADSPPHPGRFAPPLVEYTGDSLILPLWNIKIHLFTIMSCYTTI